MNLASLIKVGSLRGAATATHATFATHSPSNPPTVATVATVAVANAPDSAANDSQPDPDRWCWPATEAMNTREIDTFTMRLALFTDKGMALDIAESLADKLVTRDREKDDRAVCFECTHLQRGGRCGNWQIAGVARRAGDAQLPVELLHQLQHCDGFSDQYARAGS